MIHPIEQLSKIVKITKTMKYSTLLHRPKVKEIGRSMRSETMMNIDELQRNMKRFIEDLNNTFKDAPEKIRDLRVTRREVYIEVNGKGKIELSGTGVDIGATGGLRFILEK